MTIVNQWVPAPDSWHVAIVRKDDVGDGLISINKLKFGWKVKKGQLTFLLGIDPQIEFDG